MAVRIDLCGAVYGKLTVLSRADDYISPVGKHESNWLCQCSCGNTKVVRQSDLRSGKTKSCGHCPRATVAPAKIKKKNYKDIAGKRFGRLIAIEHIPNHNRKHAKWRCVCDCGKTTYVCLSSLSSGKTKSCGCLTRDRTIQRNIKHGKVNSRIYREWKAMRERCYRPGHQYFQYYGGKGIEVCDEWRNNFEAFYDWSMKNGYSDTLTIDRKDNSKNYSPDNCRWATRQQQANNRTNSLVVAFQGELLPISEIQSRTGESYGQIYRRARKEQTAQRIIDGAFPW